MNDNPIYESNFSRNLEWKELEEYPDLVIEIILLIEDQRFYEHVGFDPLRIVKALMNNMIAQKVVEGGSTISQQMAKNLFLTNEQTLSRKFSEIFIASQMEMQYSKEEILESYLNTLYFGHGIYGFHEASQFFFNQELKDCSIAQITMMIGVINGPSIYSPYIDYEASIDKTHTLLSYLKNIGYLDEENYLSSINENVNLAEEKYEKSQQIIRGFHLPVKLSRFHYRTIASVAKTTLEREGGDDIRMSVGYITGMEERIELIAGRMYEDTGDENLIEVIVNQEAMQKRDIFLDEELVFEQVLNEKEEPLHVKIVGIFVPVDNTDVYWTESQEDLSLEFFMKEELFKDTFYSRDHSGYEFKYDTLFDFHNIDSKQAEVIEKNTNAWLKAKVEYLKIQKPDYLEVLETFIQKEKKISGTLFILQIPCLVLLCAFLFMISEQMLRMEQNEISMLKSRGAKRGQILGLYFLQSTLIAFVGLLIGLPLGMFLCSLLGSAGAFLEFDLNDLLPTALTGEAVIYGIVAMGISIGMTVLPVVKYSGVSIVNLKQRSQKLTKPFWQKCFLDIILIALAGYAYYNFSKTQENIKEQVLRGESLDPFLYFGATFFILGLGLLFLRLHPLFIKLLYVIRKKRLSSAAYMSFLSTIRTSAKQQFIMLFVILTVSFGIFYATVARTILENAENNLAYFAPVDMMMQEKEKEKS